MAQSVAARGPLTFLLQSSTGQYATLGLGVYALFPDQVKQALAPLLGEAYMKYLTETGRQLQQQGSQQLSPIIIQTPPSTIIHSHSGGSSKSLSQVLIYSVAGAGACWVGYIVCSQLLPDAISEFMPVTKRLFKTTSEALGTSIAHVKQALEEQLQQVLKFQDKLSSQQDVTQKSVEDVKGELSKARNDLSQLQSSLDNVEAGMDETKQLQGYTLKGIQLLVRCVTSFLPDESQYIHDISQYIHEDQQAISSRNNTNRPLRAVQAPPQPMQQQPQPPSKLNLLPSRSMNSSNDNMHVSSLPHISSISSYEDDEDDEIPGGNYMGDIRALLGH